MTNRNTLLTIIFVNVSLLGVLFAIALNYTQETASVVHISSQDLVAPVPLVSVLNEKSAPFASILPPTDMLAPSSPVSIANSQFQKAQESFSQLSLPVDHSHTQREMHPLTHPIEQPQTVSGLLPARDSEMIEVRVKSGDTLGKIARTYHSSIEEIKKVNRLRSNQLAIGQKLKIPTTVQSIAASPTSLSSETKEIASNLEGGSEYYIVRPGDNPWKIATKHKMKLDQLLELNHLDQESAKQLKVGDKLRIR